MKGNLGNCPLTSQNVSLPVTNGSCMIQNVAEEKVLCTLNANYSLGSPISNIETLFHSEVGHFLKLFFIIFPLHFFLTSLLSRGWIFSIFPSSSSFLINLLSQPIKLVAPQRTEGPPLSMVNYYRYYDYDYG